MSDDELEWLEEPVPVPRPERECDACGHHHPTMAMVWNGPDGPRRYYCHENDHSCYTDRRKEYGLTGWLLTRLQDKNP